LGFLALIVIAMIAIGFILTKFLAIDLICSVLYRLMTIIVVIFITMIFIKNKDRI